MQRHLSGRRDFLGKMTALAAGLPALAAVSVPRLAEAAAGATKTAYDPAAKLDITVSEIELRRNAAGRMLMARVYQPAGPGPFPTVLDLHGGAWNNKDRFAEEPMDRAIASSGVLVVAIDMTRAPEAPYPAGVQDANYAVRWLKWKAPMAINTIPAGPRRWVYRKAQNCGRFSREVSRRLMGGAALIAALLLSLGLWAIIWLVVSSMAWAWL